MAVRMICLYGVALLASGCNSAVADLYPTPLADRPVEIFIVNNLWHTGFVIQRERMSDPIKRFLSRFENSQYVEIGWGDDRFYRAPRGTSGLAMQAMFASKGTVLHVVGIDIDPISHYSEFKVDLYRLHISEKGLARLLSFIEKSFDVDAAGNSIELQAGLYGFSEFYRARGWYGACHTCNHWLADGVRETGFPITPSWAGTADNVGWQLRHFGAKYESDILVLRG